MQYRVYDQKKVHLTPMGQLRFQVISKNITLILLAFLVVIICHGQDRVDTLREKLRTGGNDSQRVVTYFDIYHAYRYANPDSAAFYLNAGLNEFAQKEYPYGIARMKLGLGNLDIDRGNLDMAQRRVTDALKTLRAVNSQAGIAAAYNAIGEIEARKGNIDTASQYFFAALKINEATNNDVGAINTLTNLGIVASMAGNLKGALDHYNKALEHANEQSSVRVISSLYNNIAIIYGRMGDLGKAKSYLEKAKEKGDLVEFVDVYIYSLLNLAIVYQQSGDNKTAISYLNEALQLAREKKLPSEEMQLLINKATILRFSSPDSAIVLLNKAVEIGKSIGNKSLLEDAYVNLVLLHKDRKEYKEVATLLEQEMEIRDSLVSVDKAKAIASLQSVYELNESNSKLKEISLELQQQQLKKRLLVITAIALLAVVLFVVLYLVKTKQLYRILSMQKEELQLANNTKDKLFSIISHDMRGPLGNVTEMLEILEQDDDSEDRKFYTGLLKTQSRTALNTLDTLLFWGRSQIKGNEIRNEVFDAAKFVRENLQLLDMTARKKDIAIEHNIDNCPIVGDSTHFDFVFRNLLSNAIKYTHSGGHVKITADVGGEPGFIVFSISDDGVGMSSDKLSSLFESLSHSAAGTAGETGTGIGLMLCKEFVDANGGKIWAESEAGKGSTFYFSFRSV